MKKQLLFLTSIFCVMLLQAQMRMPQSNLPRFNRWLNNDEFVINTKLKAGTPQINKNNSNIVQLIFFTWIQQASVGIVDFPCSLIKVITWLLHDGYI